MDHGGEAYVCLVTTHGNSLELLQFTEEVLDQVAPFVDVAVNLKRLFSTWHLRDDDFGAALVERGDDPVGVKRLVGSAVAASYDVTDYRQCAAMVTDAVS